MWELFWLTDYPNRPHPSPSFTLASPPHMASITAEWGSGGRRSTHALLIDVTPGLRNFNTAKKCWAFLSSINTEDGLYRRGKYPNTVHTFAKRRKKGGGKTGLRLYISNTKTSVRGPEGEYCYGRTSSTKDWMQNSPEDIHTWFRRQTRAANVILRRKWSWHWASQNCRRYWDKSSQHYSGKNGHCHCFLKAKKRERPRRRSATVPGLVLSVLRRGALCGSASLKFRTLTGALSVERGAVISRHFFCIMNIFSGLHIIFICKIFYTKKGSKKNKHIHNMIKSTLD